MLTERFWARVTKTDDCWLWTGHGTRKNYGVFSVHHRNRPAHIVAWEDANGLVPDGYVLDHLCHTAACGLGDTCPHRRCVRPDHLAVTLHRDNTLRGAGPTAVNSSKTHCDAGHPFDVANTYWTPTGKRNCRTCKRETQARYAARKKATQ